MKSTAKDTFGSINYSLRPAKSIERKMLCEAIRRLASIERIEAYQYVGMGATHFVDFSLFHKSLGIEEMVSMQYILEEEKKNAENVKSRYHFNKPFSCIKIEFEDARAVLTTLDWTKKTILWLDYVSSLTSSVLFDIGTFIAQAKPGSMIIISVNAHQKLDESVPSQEIAQRRFKKFQDEIGKNKIPEGVKGSDLNSKDYKIHKVYQQIILDEIEEKVSTRNNGNKQNSPLIFKQLLNMRYQDGAEMYTIGGILYSKEQEDLVKSSRFEDLDFVKSDSEIFSIDIPNLTFKEINYLNSLLPLKLNSDGSLNLSTPLENGIPEEDVKKFMKIYRYFPTFAEAIL